MALSGASSFNPDVGDIIQEAFDRAGVPFRSAYDLITARRSLNLLTLEWSNRGINLWTIEEVELITALPSTTTLIEGEESYDIDINTIALLDLILRTDDGSVTNQTDYQLNRISQPTYATIPNKLTKGRPLQYYFQRIGIRDTADDVDQTDRITLWPVPDSSTKYKIRYWRMKRMSDTGVGATSTMEVPARFLPALVSGLAYMIGVKTPEAVQRLPMLKSEYQEQFALAAEEDRIKTSVRFVPNLGY